MSSKFTSGKRIGTELLEDILRKEKGLSPKTMLCYHKQRYNALINEFNLVEFSGFLYSIAKTYLKHPIQMYQIFHLNQYNKDNKNKTE